MTLSLKSAALLLLVHSLASCVPISRDSFYAETAEQSSSGTQKRSDLIGKWFDAYDWNGHSYTKLVEIRPDGTGAELDHISWRTGGGLKTVQDIRWEYQGNGRWNLVSSNPRTLAGSGRFSTKPYPFSARLINGRVYDDTRKRTWVKADDKEAVANKKLDMQWTGEARNARNQEIQGLGRALDELNTALQ